MMYQYKSDFFNYVDVSSGRSASAFLSAFNQYFKPKSVVDFGCGRGVWLAAWKNLGVTDILGIDGEYVDVSSLKIPQEQFKAVNLNELQSLGRRFDLVECLEVAEHLFETSAETLVKSLVAHGDYILFSAAVPGQGGEHHVNEQPLSYWADKFKKHNYRVYDFPRLITKDMSQIEPWYRYNSLLYVKDTAVHLLPEIIAKTEIKADQIIPDYAPLSWRLRCAVLSLLPSSVVNFLARIKHRISA